jgi:hypothetical protein
MRVQLILLLNEFILKKGTNWTKRETFHHLFKPQRGDINIAWGSAPGNPSNAPGNPSYDRVEYSTTKRSGGTPRLLLNEEFTNSENGLTHIIVHRMTGR